MACVTRQRNILKFEIGRKEAMKTFAKETLNQSDMGPEAGWRAIAPQALVEKP